MRFEKWQALGNDYVIVEAGALPWELTPERVRRLCEPHFGVGSDGVLALSKAEDPRHVAELRIFNPDGSEAELSGNGARQAALYLRRSGWTDTDEFSILTKAGEVRPTISSPDTATLAMGRASVTSPDFPSGGPDGTGALTAGGAAMALPACLDRQPAVRDRGGGGGRGAGLGLARPRGRAQRAVPEPHQRLVHQDRRLRGQSADLRTRGGGDAVLRDRRERCSGGGRPPGRVQPDHGDAWTGESFRSRWERTSRCG